MGSIEKHISSASRRTSEFGESLGQALVDGFHLLALFVIGGAIVWSAVFAFLEMVRQGSATVEDILLLFIYLELGAMVGVYFNTNHMPLRFLIYVAITALTRMMIGFINVEHRPDQGILLISGAILMLTVAILVLRFGSHWYPSVKAVTAAEGGGKTGNRMGEDRAVGGDISG